MNFIFKKIKLYSLIIFNITNFVPILNFIFKRVFR